MVKLTSIKGAVTGRPKKRMLGGTSTLPSDQALLDALEEVASIDNVDQLNGFLKTYPTTRMGLKAARLVIIQGGYVDGCTPLRNPLTVVK